jgi:hypothetical protein
VRAPASSSSINSSEGSGGPRRLAAGNTSTTDAPGAFDGPAFDAVTVYVTPPPGVTDVTPSVLVIAKSAVGL